MKYIEINKAYQNNLKGVSAKIPLGSFTLVCGLSGSGKSSLAFETLYAEGQRRYLQNLSNYLKQYIIQQKAPNVESIRNLPPALALEQKNNIKSSRSTVASLSGLADHLRLIFEKLACPYCPTHHLPLKSLSLDQMAEHLVENFQGEKAFLAVQVFSENLPNSKVFLNRLKQKGFSRLLFPKGDSLKLDQVKNIEDVKVLRKKKLYLLIDRFFIQSEHKSRLRDSLRQAFTLDQTFPFERKVFSERAVVQVLNGKQRLFSKHISCPVCAYEFPQPLTANLFNFNSPLGACSSCEGYGYTLEIDENKVIPHPKRSLKAGAVQPFQNPSAQRWKLLLKKYCEQKKIPYGKPWCDLSARQRKKLWQGDGAFKGISAYFKRLESKRYKMHIRILLSRYKSSFVCPTCKGTKLKSNLDNIFFHGKTFNDFMRMNLGQIKGFFDREKMSSLEQESCSESLQALLKNLKYLNALGLSYLNLNRGVNTLSGGEFQRLNLSNQLGLSLSQVLYVLDEPTIGLHPRDTDRMIDLLKELKNLGNTLVVVEHDQDVMKNSEYIIEMGPGSGSQGGEVLWSGKAEEFLNSSQSNTAPYLKRQNFLLRKARPVHKKDYRYRLLMEGCKGHNLKNINLFIPLNRFVVVTGVSGSGKSSLVVNTLYPALKKSLLEESFAGLPYEKLIGSEFLKEVVLMDQSGMGRSSRSTILSYIKSFDIIRQLFAKSPLSERQGFRPSHFSLNVEGGRCSSCKGTGYQEIDMLFMDPLQVECEDCKGKKYKEEVLKVRYQDKNIYEVLNLTVEEGFQFFKQEASLLRAFSSLKEVGLSYLSLGQSIGSLSGGERQRLRLSRELLKSQQQKTLYILDEPTKGLHFKEVELLVRVIDRLVETGGSFLVIEHNMDFIKEADYVIDVGPEAGNKGGRILTEGSPEDILDCRQSHTARYLQSFLSA